MFLHGTLNFIFFSLIPTKIISSKVIDVVANKANRPIDKTTLVLFLHKRGFVEIFDNKICLNKIGFGAKYTGYIINTGIKH